MVDLSPFETVGLLTHLVVLVVGLAGTAKVLPLPRGRRSGLGLALMALAMTVLVVWPRWQQSGDWVAAAVYAAGFALALWLLVGPMRPKTRGAQDE